MKMILIQDGSQNTNVDKPLRIIGDPYKVQVSSQTWTLEDFSVQSCLTIASSSPPTPKPFNLLPRMKSSVRHFAAPWGCGRPSQVLGDGYSGSILA